MWAGGGPKSGKRVKRLTLRKAIFRLGCNEVCNGESKNKTFAMCKYMFTFAYLFYFFYPAYTQQRVRY